MNICRYYCDWTSRIKEIRFDPNRYEIPESVRTSMASVYYDKYDFTCQQVLKSIKTSLIVRYLGVSRCSFEVWSCSEADIRKCNSGRIFKGAVLPAQNFVAIMELCKMV